MIELAQKALKAFERIAYAGLRKDCVAAALLSFNGERGVDEEVKARADALYDYSTRGR